MTSLAVISNPRSQRNRQGALKDLRALLAGYPHIRHDEVQDFDDLGPLIVNLIRNKVEIIAVNGGDGTVQAVLTELGRRDLNGKAPKLAVIGGGMTNVIAKDVGFDNAPPKAMRRLIAALERSEGKGQCLTDVTRPLISLSLCPSDPPVYGMFFGTAGFYQAVRLANERVRKKGIAGNIASVSTLALSIARLFLGRSDRDDPFCRGERLNLTVDGAKEAEETSLILIATTLDRLMLGLMPFWDGDHTAIRFTNVAFPPKRLARALLPVLRGRPKGWMREAGYRSGAARDLAIEIESPVVLDGEIFHPRPGIPIRLTGDRHQTFVRC
jgi:diacylglycerol kinase family enzyme